MITFTVDLEDPAECYKPDGRYVATTRRILALCDELGRRATFFTVGQIAQSAPELVKDIAAKGHEIAYHSHAHIPLTAEIPARFRRQSRDDKERLEQLAGKNVIGFRAPRFSLTPKSLWTLDILGELGFRYSSSIMPTSVSLFGFSKAPRAPFKWPNGMIELPLPVSSYGSLRMPYLGGIYLYATPLALIKRGIAAAAKKDILWTYAHPYDFDCEEEFRRMAHASFGISFALWIARRVAEKKIRAVLAYGDAPPLGERIEAIGAGKSLPLFAGGI